LQPHAGMHSYRPLHPLHLLHPLHPLHLFCPSLLCVLVCSLFVLEACVCSLFVLEASLFCLTQVEHYHMCSYYAPRGPWRLNMRRKALGHS
jgi:hypothetical protein